MEGEKEEEEGEEWEVMEHGKEEKHGEQEAEEYTWLIVQTPGSQERPEMWNHPLGVLQGHGQRSQCLCRSELCPEAPVQEENCCAC